MFFFDDFHGKKVLKSTLLVGCEHFFTTRDIILHKGTRDDLSKSASDGVDFLLKNFNLNHDNLYRVCQTHSSNVVIADKDTHLYENTDGIILTEPDMITFLNFADCVPVILYDEKLNIGSVVHAGWRGTASKIVQIAIEKMMSLGSNPDNLSSAIGPSIGKCCFCVNEDVFLKITDGIEKLLSEEIYSFDKNSEKFYVDLKLINKILLEQMFVKNIDVGGYCTSCKNDVFFSYRKENGNTARHSAVLKLRYK